jgi:hypothetical protein
MDAYIQDDLGAQLVYWIERSGGAIVGWFATPRMFNQHLGVSPEARVDVHFTYPVNGDLHFSLKDQTSPAGDETFETVFSDRVRRKDIVDSRRSIFEGPRTETDPDWHILMPTYRPHPLSAYANEPLRFCFATSGIPVVEGRVAASALDRLPRVQSLAPQVKPIIVSPLKSGTLNIGACLIGLGASSVWPSEQIVWSARDETRFPHIHLFALFYPTDVANEVA